MTVVFHHCLVIFPLFWAAYEARHVQLPPLIRMMAFSPLHLAWGGAEAVNVFFVLSGLVLTFPFLGPKPPRAVLFILKRLIRIYLPYIAVMAAATVLMEVFLPFGHPHVSVWFDQYWNRHASGFTVLNYGLMLGLGGENFVNPVMWSLSELNRFAVCGAERR